MMNRTPSQLELDFRNFCAWNISMAGLAACWCILKVSQGLTWTSHKVWQITSAAAFAVLTPDQRQAIPPHVQHPKL